MEAPPPTARVRPAKCPGCGVAARPLGARLHVVGHGVRERQVRGPLRAGRPPGLVVVRVRRFRCRVCGAVITVLPRGVAPRRHFGAGAIGLAIAWFADGTPARKIRENVGGIGPPEGGWVTLRSSCLPLIEDGAPCEHSTTCQSRECLTESGSDASSTRPGTCTPRVPPGQPCGGLVQRALCDDTGYCAPTPDGTSLCLAKQPNGAACDEDWMCLSNACDPTTKLCTPRQEEPDALSILGYCSRL